MPSCMDLMEEQFTLQPGPDAKTFLLWVPLKGCSLSLTWCMSQSYVIRYRICCLQKPDKFRKNYASLVVEISCVFSFTLNGKFQHVPDN